MKKLIIILFSFFQMASFSQVAMPLFTQLPTDVQSDIAAGLAADLKLGPARLNEALSQIVLVADITRSMPGIDQGYLAIVEDPQYGDVKARFDIAIVYGTQGSSSGILANLINYSFPL